jgi:hypothetical protein
MARRPKSGTIPRVIAAYLGVEDEEVEQVEAEVEKVAEALGEGAR